LFGKIYAPHRLIIAVKTVFKRFSSGFRGVSWDFSGSSSGDLESSKELEDIGVIFEGLRGEFGDFWDVFGEKRDISEQENQQFVENENLFRREVA